MNIAIIFAGGTGQRMKTKTKPKQFLELYGKPILVYTLEKFQNCDDIDEIIVVMLEDWIPLTKRLAAKYNLSKVKHVIPGGSTGQESIFNGLKKAAEEYPEDSVVLIHDGVRPLVKEDTISDCVKCVYAHGNAITVAPVVETVTLGEDENLVGEVLKREHCMLAKAPQCFVLKDIYSEHLKAKEAGEEFIDSASLMQAHGHKLYKVRGSLNNIKITTPVDYYMFKAIYDSCEDSEVFG